MNTNVFTRANDIIERRCDEVIRQNHLAYETPSRVMVTVIREEIADRLGMSQRELCEIISGDKPHIGSPKEILTDEFALGGYILRDKKTGDYLAATKDGSIAYTINPTGARVFGSLKHAMGFRKHPGWEVFKRVSLTMEKVDVDGYEKALANYESAKAELEKYS